MNNIKDFTSHINEGLSPLLYHFTYSASIANIVQNNQLYATTSLGSSADHKHNKGKAFFLSTQRSKNAKIGYGGAPKSSRNACIVLDGVKLQQRYTGKPVDYWTYSRDAKDYSTKADYVAAQQMDELEDRIILDSPFIDNANKYILEIHILIEDRSTKDWTNTIIEHSKQLGIPVYFYDNDNYFANQQKSKAIDPATFTFTRQDFVEEDENREYNRAIMYIDRIMGIVAFKNPEAIEKLKSMFSGEIPERITNRIKSDEENYFQYGHNIYGIDDYCSSLISDLHNARAQANPLIKQALWMLAKDMKRYKATKIHDYVYTKLGRPSEGKKAKNYIYTLRNDGYEVSWDKSAWYYMSNDEFYLQMPKHYWYDLEIAELMNDMDATMRKVYNFFMKKFGRKWVDKAFKEVGDLDVERREDKPAWY